MPTSMGAGRPQTAAQTNGLREAIDALAGRTDALWRRLQDIEQALGVREWWLLGRALPEARLLSEISSLLAVARGEMENLLTQIFGRTIPRNDQTDQFAAVPGAEELQSDDPAWLAASRDQAIGLLRMVAAALPAMLQYAEMLQGYAERIGLAPAVLDAFSIVAERLDEVREALRYPPQ